MYYGVIVLVTTFSMIPYITINKNLWIAMDRRHLLLYSTRVLGIGLGIFIYCLQRDKNMSSDLSISELVKRIKDYLKKALSDLQIVTDHEGANVVVRVCYHQTTGGVTQVMNLNEQQKREIKMVANKLIQEFRLAIKTIFDNGTQLTCRFSTV